MRNRISIIIGVSLVTLWVAAEVSGGRRGGGGGGGRGGGGGGRGGGGFSGGARPGGMPGGGARPGGGMPGGGAINRTPSFSPPGGGRPAQMPSRPSGPALGSRPNVGVPSQLPAGSRPNLGTGAAQLPAGGNRPGGRGQITTLPSNRPDVGGRPGIGNRPSTLPALGAGVALGAGAALGSGLADRASDRAGRLPGLGDGRPSQLPARTPEQRREALGDRLAGGERPSQLPSREWNQVRQGWQDRRDEIREDWQQHRGQARDDWQNWFDDHYPGYGGWYSGYAPGYWGRWDSLWDNYPVAATVGLTWWGVNSLGYAFGCSDYTNPYYAEAMPVDYSAPVLTMPLEVAQEPAAPTASGLPPGVSAEAVAKFDQARAAFLDSRYDEALKLTDAAVAKMPRDAVLHEFRSLVLFGLKRYHESAAAIHAVLDVGPGWDSQTMTGLYPDMDTYTGQLRALEAARNKAPKDAALRFLVGYHYLTLGHQDSALKMFRQVSELQPNDAVAAALVATLSPRDAQPTPPSITAAPKAVPAADVVGGWAAASRGTAKYAMDLKKDGTFTWDFSRGSRKQQAKGVYAVQGNVLALEPDTGGVLLAELTVRQPDLLHFKMVGGKEDDPGLEFRRGASQ